MVVRAGTGIAYIVGEDTVVSYAVKILNQRATSLAHHSVYYIYVSGPSNRGHLSASTPSPSGLAPVYKSVAAASFYRYRYRFTYDGTLRACGAHPILQGLADAIGSIPPKPVLGDHTARAESAAACCGEA